MGVQNNQDDIKHGYAHRHSGLASVALQTIVRRYLKKTLSMVALKPMLTGSPCGGLKYSPPRRRRLNAEQVKVSS
jgi:hypothetical protein